MSGMVLFTQHCAVSNVVFFTCVYTLHFQPMVKNVFVFCSIEKHFLSAIISLWIFLYLALLFFYAFLLPRSSEIEA